MQKEVRKRKEKEPGVNAYTIKQTTRRYLQNNRLCQELGKRNII